MEKKDTFGTLENETQSIENKNSWIDFSDDIWSLKGLCKLFYGNNINETISLMNK
jgi:hypothetical protein